MSPSPPRWAWAGGLLLVGAMVVLWSAESATLEGYSQHVDWLTGGAKTPAQWGVDDVTVFLRSRGLERYEESFRAARVDGTALLHLDEAGLIALRVDDKLDRESLLWDIAHMQAMLPTREVGVQVSLAPGPGPSLEVPGPGPGPGPVSAPVAALVAAPAPAAVPVPVPEVPAQAQPPAQAPAQAPTQGPDGSCAAPAALLDWEAIQWPEATCEAILERDTEEPLFLPFYKCVYEEMHVHKTRPLKFAGFRQGDGTGWGNRMRGMVAAFHMAMITGRTFFNTHPMFWDHFEEPNAHVRTHWKEKRAAYEKAGSFLTLKPNQDKGQMRAILEGRARHTFDRFDFIEFYQGNAQDVEMFTHPDMKALGRKLYGTDSRLGRTGLVMQFLCQAPVPAYVEVVEDVRAIAGLDVASHIVFVQLRTFKDAKRSYGIWQEHQDAYWECLVRRMPEVVGEGHSAADTVIFFATDDDDQREKAERVLAPFGRVTNNGLASTHTKDWHKSGGVSGAMVDWFLLGSAHRTVHGGTSFGIFATARTNFCNGDQTSLIMMPAQGEFSCADLYHLPMEGAEPGVDVLYR